MSLKVYLPSLEFSNAKILSPSFWTSLKPTITCWSPPTQLHWHISKGLAAIRSNFIPHHTLDSFEENPTKYGNNPMIYTVFNHSNWQLSNDTGPFRMECHIHYPTCNAVIWLCRSPESLALWQHGSTSGCFHLTNLSRAIRLHTIQQYSRCISSICTLSTDYYVLLGH